MLRLMTRNNGKMSAGIYIYIGLSTRLRRNCSTDQLYRKRSAELKARLCHRGYKAKSVQKAVSEVGAKDRANLLEYKTKSIVSWVHLVTTYHPAVSGLPSILRKHLPTLQKSERLFKAIPVPPNGCIQKAEKHQGPYCQNSA